MKNISNAEQSLETIRKVLEWTAIFYTALLWVFEYHQEELKAQMKSATAKGKTLQKTVKSHDYPI